MVDRFDGKGGKWEKGATLESGKECYGFLEVQQRAGQLNRTNAIGSACVNRRDESRSKRPREETDFRAEAKFRVRNTCILIPSLFVLQLIWRDTVDE